MNKLIVLILIHSTFFIQCPDKRPLESRHQQILNAVAKLDERLKAITEQVELVIENSQKREQRIDALERSLNDTLEAKSAQIDEIQATLQRHESAINHLHQAVKPREFFSDGERHVTSKARIKANLLIWFLEIKQETIKGKTVHTSQLVTDIAHGIASLKDRISQLESNAGLQLTGTKTPSSKEE